MDSHRNGRYYAEMVKVAGGDEKEGMREEWSRNCISIRWKAVLGFCTRSRRGGTQILEEEEDARLLDRCEAKREEWAKHWQCDESVQKVEDRPWKMRN